MKGVDLFIRKKKKNTDLFVVQRQKDLLKNLILRTLLSQRTSYSWFTRLINLHERAALIFLGQP